MRVLFLCVANSARSQMAEGLAKYFLDPAVEVRSAGSTPLGMVNPLAVEVLREREIDISTHRSKSIQDLPKGFIENLDAVVTLCAEEVCPTLLSRAKKLNWAMPDPARAGLSETEQKDEFRRTREELIKRFHSEPLFQPHFVKNA